MTHCEAGRRIGQAWNLFPSFIDVFENHHHPERSVRDPLLVGIVAAADHFAEWRACDPTKEGEPVESAEPESAAEDEFLRLSFPRLDARARSELTEMLETEYLHLLPVIEFNSSVEQPLAEKQV